jgi:hypothetical protein
MRFCFLTFLFLKRVAKRTVSVFKHGFLFLEDFLWLGRMGIVKTLGLCLWELTELI